MPIRIHPRYFKVKEAELKLSGFLIELIQAYDLTFAETFKILGAMIDTQARYAIREERHPDDPDRRGDEE